MSRTGRVLTGLVFFFLAGNGHAGDPLQGSSLYSKHCAGCHGGNGKGIIAGTPDLAGNPQIMIRPDFQLLNVILRGKGIMPAYQGKLSDRQIRDIISHIRTFF